MTIMSSASHTGEVQFQVDPRYSFKLFLIEGKMNVLAALNTLKFARSSSLLEKSIASSLLASPGVDRFLDDLRDATLVVVSLQGTPTEWTESIIRRFAVKIVMFPLQTLDICSSSTNDISRLSAALVGEFVRKLCRLSQSRVKGIVVIAAGVTLNDFSTPGPIIWKLQGNTCMTYKVKNLEAILSVLYFDMFAECCQTSTLPQMTEYNSCEATVEEICTYSKHVIVHALIEFDLRAIDNLLEILPQRYLVQSVERQADAIA